MSPADNSGKVDLDLEAVRQALGMTVRELLNAQASQAAGHAVANVNQNGTIDTGFMINTIGPILVGESGPAAREATLPSVKTGEEVTRRSVAGPTIGEDESAVYCGADYAYFVERKAPFMGPTVDQVNADMATILANAKQGTGF